MPNKKIFFCSTSNTGEKQTRCTTLSLGSGRRGEVHRLLNLTLPPATIIQKCIQAGVKIGHDTLVFHVEHLPSSDSVLKLIKAYTPNCYLPPIQYDLSNYDIGSKSTSKCAKQLILNQQKELLNNLEREARFIRIAENISNQEHNIVQVVSSDPEYNYNERQNTIEFTYIAWNIGIIMPLIPGNSLETIQNKKIITVSLGLRIAQASLSALEQLHDKKLAHQDIFSGNIIIKQITQHEIEAKFIDFGLSETINTQNQDQLIAKDYYQFINTFLDFFIKTKCEADNSSKYISLRSQLILKDYLTQYLNHLQDQHKQNCYITNQQEILTELFKKVMILQELSCQYSNAASVLSASWVYSYIFFAIKGESTDQLPLLLSQLFALFKLINIEHVTTINQFYKRFTIVTDNIIASDICDTLISFFNKTSDLCKAKAEITIVLEQLYELINHYHKLDTYSRINFSGEYIQAITQTIRTLPALIRAEDFDTLNSHLTSCTKHKNTIQEIGVTLTASYSSYEDMAPIIGYLSEDDEKQDGEVMEDPEIGMQLSQRNANFFNLSPSRGIKHDQPQHKNFNGY